MGVLNLDALDDPLLDDFTPDFTGGMSSVEPASRLQINQAALLENIDIDDKVAATRRGSRRLGLTVLFWIYGYPRTSPLTNEVIPTIGDYGPIQGLFYYDTPASTSDFHDLVAVAGGWLFRYNGVDWTRFGAYQASSVVTRVEIAQLVDKLYIAEIGTNLFEFDGGTLVDLAPGSTPNTEPPRGSILISHTNRLWMAGIRSIEDGLYCSQPLTPGTWDKTLLAIRVGGGDGDPITGLCGWDEFQLVVGKKDSLWRVAADPAATATSLATAEVSKISGEIGVVSHRSMCQVGKDVWFLSPDGVRSVARSIANEQREISETISAPIDDLIDRINWAWAHNAAAVFWHNRYLLAVPLDGSQENNFVLCYNTVRQAWSGYWTNLNPHCWAKSREDIRERLNFGRLDSEIWQWRDDVRAVDEDTATFTDGDGQPVATRIVTRAHIFNDAISPKAGATVEFEYFKGTAEQSVSVILDGDTEVSLGGEFLIGVQPLILNFVLPQVFPTQGIKRVQRDLMQFEPFREIQFDLRTTDRKQALRSILCSAYLNTREIDET